MQFKKLVRDKIPDVIEQNGRTPIYHVADNAEFETELIKKLREEVNEYIENQTPEEMIDILEVIIAIYGVKNYDKDKLEELRVKKLQDRGGFFGRIILDETK
ncbi:MAG: hypothetical protein A2725_00585 [Candidatus Magasanikbacteria bacterium RIFCSPHIGHO2_01_FULL_33_34]|uniref:Phosphoribosyl-ATP pyrophosphohydrolase n=1 Tax=Candidatus Magasanikbacteria bacterium RIFCSPHIGHO2_01_FULL_33_34 TaxID=1798671 RepID=A0A1F6LL72_9BACT|nr:MAG: hypothetical protein A2725_00585 [Candidatus Magasanikbacteria bacterium RIFCSPHIGHO2_01_FULL_33_34]OGH65856.1 MAG: hypothetical protein A3B83_03255 [Candidatus Magasanikbacteria bacterium RIFCSPHIGHO2_02_FULL_33_17]OGH75221.1 MAG: hypothetical protein A3A89_03850 [Candidatus Magasanikbacteria bacterium RIFCSPLOWO2_01_FULL_33_34]OGH82205.1 MAG: hypothetical protein A3F93_04890 [Candidatus Magasanikbacteria bacterium RIFCSPLOWO2_12_FULL_34_7]